MPWDVIFFYLIATVSVLTAIGVIAARNPVHSAIFLVLCFLNVAGIFVMLGAEFVAVVQVIVYTGAILVLVLFVLMLVDPSDLPSFTDSQPMQRYLGALLGVLLLGSPLRSSPGRPWRPPGTPRPKTSPLSAATPRRLARCSSPNTCWASRSSRWCSR